MSRVMFAARFDPSSVSVREVAKRRIDEVSDASDASDVSESETESVTAEDSESETSETSDESDSDIEMADADTGSNEIEDAATSKHANVLSRFKTSAVTASKAVEESLETSDESDTEVHQLGPIPQPALPKDVKLSKGNDKDLDWISKFYISGETKPFDSYPINSKILHNIKQEFTTTFAVQSTVLDILIPEIIQYRLKKDFNGDILVNASTGSGKTLAYSIPIVQALSTRVVPRLRCIIIVPTKILINQVYQTLLMLSRGLDLNIVTTKAETSLKEEHAKLAKNVPDVLITTPGRLVDHLTMETFSLDSLKYLVLDEADRLLNQSFQNWLNEINGRIPSRHMKMIFSATLTTNSAKLYDLQLYKPRLVLKQSLKLYNLPASLSEFNVAVPTAKSIYKPLFLLRLLENRDAHKVLVFMKSNENSVKLAKLLPLIVEALGLKQLNVDSINSTSNRRQVLQNFTAGQGRNVLITTDLMSRGIDINVDTVINYDLPLSSKEYVHRCGRTARAGNNGDAINILVGKGESKFWTEINEDLSRDNDAPVAELQLDTNVDENVAEVYKKCLTNEN